MPKKKPKPKPRLELRVYKLTFKCPNGHPMSAEYLDFDHPPSIEREIENVNFAVYCLPCKWEGMKPGREKATIRLAGKSPERG